MDNLTHSLVGAVLGQAGLKRKSGLAMPTLIIAANIPDIDATCTVLGMVSLSMRRGITHGPIAMLVLPLLLTWAMIAWDRRQTRRGTRPVDRPEVRPNWLLALAFIGCLSHPLFDWMNSYGVRLLEPFSHRWFYGDALFIVDPWLLAMLIAGVWMSLKQERGAALRWTRPARTAGLGIVVYLLVNIGISHLAATRVAGELPYPRMVVANPVPFTFWRRNVLWRTDKSYGNVELGVLGEKPAAEAGRPIVMDDKRIAERVKSNAVARAFLFWSRMPVAEKDGDAIILKDQRFMDSMTGSRFQVRLEP